MFLAYCVVPENIHTPPPPHGRDWKFRRVGGFKGPGISGEGEGCCRNEFCFFPDRSQFSYSRTLRPVPNGAPLMCRTKLNTVRLWSHFGATADSDGVLASDLIREGHGNQFSMRIYVF